jgi:hypothetical protein
MSSDHESEVAVHVQQSEQPTAVQVTTKLPDD